MTSLSFSENGYFLATTASDGVKLWDLRKLRNFRTLTPYETGLATAVQFDHSRLYLAVSGRDDARVYGTKQDWALLNRFPDLPAKVRGHANCRTIFIMQNSIMHGCCSTRVAGIHPRVRCCICIIAQLSVLWACKQYCSSDSRHCWHLAKQHIGHLPIPHILALACYHLHACIAQFAVPDRCRFPAQMSTLGLAWANYPVSHVFWVLLLRSKSFKIP